MITKILLVGRRSFGSIRLATFGLILCISSQAQPVEDLRLKTFAKPLGIQEDGKILVGGISHNLERLLPDGTPDSTFKSDLHRFSHVESVLVQEDARILVAGTIRTAGNSSVGVVRLSTEGKWDEGFNVIGGVNMFPGMFPGPVVDFDQTFFVLRLMELQRFKANGTPDTAFESGVEHVGAVLPLGNGKVLVQEMDHRRPYRLLSDGSIDPSFDSDLVGSVGAFTVQADGKILASGWDFASVQGDWSARGLVRLSPDGKLDRTFKGGVDTNGFIKELVLQADGKIIVSGYFTTLGDGSCTNLGRLNPDGTLDIPLLTPYGSTEHLALQKDGRLLMGGNIHIPSDSDTNVVNFDGYLVRLANLGPATESLTISDDDTITWLRGGTSPEVWRTVFHVSTNGRDWARLGDGERIPGGWSLSGAALSGKETVRARGFVIGARNYVLSPSQWQVESITGAPVITRDPTSSTNDAGTAAVFTAWGGATPPFAFRWQRNGVALEDGLNISGAATSVLIVSNVLTADAGDYAFVVSNSSGSVTSSVATLTVREPVLFTQPSSQDVDGGETIRLSVGVAGTEPLTYFWRRNGEKVLVGSSSALEIPNASLDHVGRYDVVASNHYGVVTSASANVTVNTALPDAFQSMVADSNGSGWIEAIAEASGQGIFAGGFFVNVNGTSRRSLVRLMYDGSVDEAFVPGSYGSNAPDVSTILVQPDGKIVVGGGTIVAYYTSGPLLNRFEADGGVDALFSPTPGRLESPEYAIRVSSLLYLPDGKLLAGGRFDTFEGEPHQNLVRLRHDGSLDPSFHATGVGGGGVYSLALQADGKILVGGVISNLLVRLNPDGQVDTTFHPAPIGQYINALVVQSDGRILVGGDFSELAGEPCQNLGRLNPNGTLDASFADFGFGRVHSIGLQADGKIIVAPYDYPVNAIRRLNADGTEDPSFVAFANGPIRALALQSDGRVLVTGGFSTIAGRSNPRFARLLNPSPATEDLRVEGALITWVRGGSSPEIWRATFEASTDGSNWTLLGDGERVAGGWALSGVALPANSEIRARGFTTGGSGNNSSWFVESRKRTSSTRPIIQPSGAKYQVEAGRLRFKVDGPVGRAVVIESSTDLQQWIPMATNQVPAGGFEFTDPEDSNVPSKYYRVRLR